MRAQLEPEPDVLTHGAPGQQGAAVVLVDHAAAASGRRVAALDLADQSFGLGGDDAAFLLDFLEPAAHVRQAAGGLARPGLPTCDIGSLGRRPLARDREPLIVRGKLSRGGLQRGPGRLVPGARGIERGAPRVGRRQRVAPRLRRVVEGFITALPGMGSIVVCLATDAPLLPHQCTRLAQRAIAASSSCSGLRRAS